MSYSDNPRHPNNPPSDYPSEPTGAVAKDSLANESISRGGGFDSNQNPEVLGVKGYQSTLNNTDTSNAEVLRPAASGSAREQEDYRGLGSDERGSAGGIKYPDSGATDTYGGITSDQGFRGGSGDQSDMYNNNNNSNNNNNNASGFGGSGGSSGGNDYDSSKISSSSGYDNSSGGGNTSSGTRPYVDQAPNYSNTDNFRSEGTYKPKGDNLQEDGSDIPPNRSTFTGDVGGPKDPGRLAEREFQKMGADSSGGMGARDYGEGTGDSNTYSDLNSSERA